MPEMVVAVRWPDGAVQECWSPSLVMHDHLAAGADYTVTEFTDRALRGLAEADDRVRARHGVACTAAAASGRQILERAERFDASAQVTVVRMVPPLPAEEP